MNKNKIKVAMQVAEAVSSLSHDTETQVGCVLIKKDSGAIIGTGYNGFIRSAPDAYLPTSGDDKHEYMMHAEKNLISNCVKEGISAKDCIVVCTLSPCPSCVRFLWQCGITEIICKEIHSSFTDVLMMQDLDVQHSSYEYNPFYTINMRSK